jgi:surface polysaccharide O-acyltransferase-like enzyme
MHVKNKLISFFFLAIILIGDNMMNKREHIFDILRIVSMFLVIVVHICNIYMRMYPKINIADYIVADLFNSISRIAVPIFFMISGSLLLDK